MEKAEAKRLAYQVALMCEKAYRRGFHHGFAVAADEVDRGIPTLAEVARWRYGGYYVALGPPGTSWQGRRKCTLERLKMELTEPDCDELGAVVVRAIVKGRGG